MTALDERIKIKEIITRLKDVSFNDLAGKLSEIFNDRGLAIIYDNDETIRVYLDDYTINFDNVQKADAITLNKGIRINDTVILNTFVDVLIDDLTVEGIIEEDYDGEYRIFVQEFVIR